MKHSTDRPHTPTTSIDAGKQDDSIRVLLEAAQSVQGRLEGALEGIGLSSAKLMALEVLASAPQPLALSELAGRLGCVRSNITQLIDRMEADGLVRRQSDPSDRRAVLAVLTEFGTAQAVAGAREVSRLQAELEARVDPAELAVLHRALRALG